MSAAGELDRWHERFEAELRRSGDYVAAVEAADARRPVGGPRGSWVSFACSVCRSPTANAVGICSACVAGG